MNRVRDYGLFAIGFVGFGYLMLWPLSSPDVGGELFGASLMCGEHSLAIMDRLCRMPHPLHLSLPLHALGFASALFVAGRISWRALIRLQGKQRRSAVAGAAPGAGLPVADRRPGCGRPAAPVRRVKARTHFGLRGMPH